MTLPEIGAYLRQLRKDQGLTQKEIADKIAHVSWRTYQDAEKGSAGEESVGLILAHYKKGLRVNSEYRGHDREAQYEVFDILAK